MFKWHWEPPCLIWEIKVPSFSDVREELAEAENAGKTLGSVDFLTEGLRIEKAQYVSNECEIMNFTNINQANIETESHHCTKEINGS